MKETLTVNSDLSLAEAIREVRKQYLERGYITLDISHGTQRTLTQNRALHLWLGMLADTLNAAGLDMRRMLKQEIDIPWSTETCKEMLWKPIQEAVIQKASTTEADRNEYSLVYDVLTRHLAEKLNIAAPEWPRKEFKTHQKEKAA